MEEKKAGGSSILDEVLNELVKSERVINGRQPETTMIIVDSKSTKNTDTADEKGYVGGVKNVGHKGASRGYTNGLPHAVRVTTANANMALIDADVEVAKRNDLHKFAVIPKVFYGKNIG